jgi:hypothetical protein
MAIQKKWAKIPPQSITSNGTQDGHITVPDASMFYVQRKVIVFSDDVSPMQLEIKRINNINDMELGPVGNINARSDLTLLLTVDNPMISAPDEQDRPAISMEDVIRASYANEPAVGLRALPIDKLGNAIDSTVGVDGKNRMAVDADVTVNTVQLFTKPYDSIAALYPTTVQEVYKTYVGGLSGTLQETVTVNYVDDSKNQLVSVVRS